MKSKWFEVEVKAFKVVVVEVRENELSEKEDYEDVALRVAHQESFSFCDNVETGDYRELNDENLESAKHHADEVL